MHEQIFQRLVCCEKNSTLLFSWNNFENNFEEFSVCMDFAKKKRVQLIAYRF